MDEIVFWLVVAMSVLIISNNNCLARNLFSSQDVIPEPVAEKNYAVYLNITSNYVRMDNGILQVTIANPHGYVTGIRYNGVDNLLETHNEESNRGYFDIVWDAKRRRSNSSMVGGSDWVPAKIFKVISNAADGSEISFSTKWDESTWDTDSPTSPINVDRRYVMSKGLAGFYSYTVLESEANYPEAKIHQIRAVYKLHKERFHYMAISDDRQRVMPMPEDRAAGQVLNYKEAVRLIDPSNPDMNGEVDDKYQYSCEDRENKVQGWIAMNPAVGFWMITPSDEFRTAGPFKGDLTSHTGPTCLQMFHSAHYVGADLVIDLKQGETWKKVFGPSLVYLNSDRGYGALWQDAKRQMMEETQKWPYDFPLSMDFAKPRQRGSVSGQLFVKDRYGKNPVAPAVNAWVGLAAVGEAGSWQVETKGYQFWLQTSENGSFLIKGVISGTYNLYATVPGFIGDYKYTTNIQIRPETRLQLGNLTYEPPRNGPTLWEIGIPDRTAAEFFVPNPNSRLVNKMLLNKPQHKFRQYGLWDQYSQQYPTRDLVYTIGESNFRKDWFFAHVTRKHGKTYKPTTWQIVFPIATLVPNATYTLRLAIASASNAEIQIRFNYASKEEPDFTTKLFGKDNAIARHGIHGLYRLFNVDVPSSRLRRGNNTVYLTQMRSTTPFQGVMYDYIRLQGPPEIK